MGRADRGPDAARAPLTRGRIRASASSSASAQAWVEVTPYFSNSSAR